MTKPTLQSILGELAFAAAWITFPMIVSEWLQEHRWTFWPVIGVQVALMLFMVGGLNCLLAQARRKGRDQRD